MSNWKLCLALVVSLDCLAPIKPLAHDQNLVAFHARQAEMLGALQSQYDDFGPKVGGYAAIGLTALKGCQHPAYMDRVIHDASSPRTELFSRPSLIRYLFQFDQCLTTEQKQLIIKAEMDPSQLFGHGTLNHALMSATSYYLLAEKYPTLKWTDNQGKLISSADITSRYKGLLLGRFGKFMKDGYYEQLSPTYSVVDIVPLLNLVDFARDPAIRTGAEEQLIAALSIMGVASFRGALMPPLTRENPPFQLNDDPPTDSRDVLWMYFGGGAISKAKRLEVPYATILAASTWQPPLKLLTLRSRTSLPYEVTIHTPSFSIWNAPTKTELSGGAYIAQDFAIGSGNFYPDPSGYNAGTVSFRIMIAGLRPVGTVECYQPYWHGDEGEDAWDTDRSSPFQFSWRRMNEGVLIYDIPAADPYRFPGNQFFALRAGTANSLHQVAECRLPAAPDQTITSSSGTFSRFGRVFVAMMALGGQKVDITRGSGKALQGFIVLKVRSAHSAIFYRVEPTSNFPSLKAFKSAVEHEAPTYESEIDQVKFTSGPTIKAHFDLTPPDADGIVVESPSFTWKDSKLFFH